MAMQVDGIHALVHRAKQGDRDAWEALIARFNPDLQEHARRRVRPGGPGYSQESLTQEVWLRAYQNLGRFAGGTQDEDTAPKFRAWLKRIADRLYLTSLRPGPHTPPTRPRSLGGGRADDSSSRFSDDVPGRDPTPSKNLDAQSRQQRTQEALETLPPPLQQIVKLRLFQGWTFLRIAQSLGCDESTVRYHFHAALKTLAPKLKGLL